MKSTASVMSAIPIMSIAGSISVKYVSVRSAPKYVAVAILLANKRYTNFPVYNPLQVKSAIDETMNAPLNKDVFCIVKMASHKNKQIAG
tara:strand:- start:1662 stop:1928 length:267 start_codon:yes stop_codon:yes gene_type:complete